MQFSDRANAISPFLAMAFGDKASELERQGKSVIRLNLGEPDFGAPDAVVRAMHTTLEERDLPYTSALGLPELRQDIAQFYQSQHGLDINPRRVVVTAGASAALLLVCAALVNAGDQVLIGDPSYPCNRQFVSSFGGDVKLIPTNAASRYQITGSMIAQHATAKTKGIMLASPANPTGTSVSPDELENICHSADQHGLWKIIDEIYLNLSLTDQQPQSVLAIDNNAIVINSFSKYFSMTGWRLGWCVVPEAMVDVMEKLAQNLYICPSTLSQHAARACFTPESLAQCEARRQQFIRRKEIVLSHLNNLPISVDVIPDGAFYVYINIKPTGLDAMDFCERLLAQEYVAMTPGLDFGTAQANQYVRLSFATDEQQLTEGMQRIRRFVLGLI